MTKYVMIGVLGLSMLTAAAQADVHVRRLCFDGSGNVASDTVVSTVSAGAQVTIDPSAFSPSCGGDGRATFVVYADSGSEDIGRVVFTGSGGTLVNDLLITGGSETEIKTAFEMTSTGRDWAGVDPGPYHMQVQARIGRDLTGSVTAGNVVRLRIGGAINASADIKQTDATQPIWSISTGGDIAGDVWAGDSSTGANGIVVVTSTAGNISGDIRAWAGNVGTVKASNGTISGSINSNRGVISRIECKNFTGSIAANGQLQAPGSYWAIDTLQVAEDIGTVSTPATITTTAGDSFPSGSGFNNGGIRSITARSIHASITTPSGANNRGDIRELVTDGTGVDPDTGVQRGYLDGQITTFSMGETGTGNDPSRALQLTGPLLGHVSLNGTLKRPAEVASVGSDGVLSLIRQDQSPTGGIIVNGGVAAGGLIEVAGDQEGLVQVNGGDVAGTIAVGMSIMNPATPMSNYTGRVEINNGSLAAGGLIEVGLSVAVASAIPGNGNPTEIKIDHDLAGTVVVGRSLLGDLTVGGDLSGQVIINANNETGANLGVWSGAVTVGTTTLSHDAQGRYSTHASDIGGGAVGLAPFHLYEGDCSPPHNDFGALPQVLASEFTDLASTPVKIVQYGPVKFSTSGHLALIIEAQNPDDECAWWDMTSMFGDPVVQTIGGSARVIGLKGSANGAPFGGVYRVSIQDCNRVVCDRVAGDPAPVWPVATCGASANGCEANDRYYLFRIYSDCNGNGIEDGYETHPPPPQEPMSADVNNTRSRTSASTMPSRRCAGATGTRRAS